MGELVEAAKALSAPATKLIEVVSRGIGRAYDPRYKKKMADATVYEVNALAEAMRQNCDLPILIEREGVRIDTSDYKALSERANSRLVFQEMRKQQNIEAIVEKAYQEVETYIEVSNDPVDDDWIVRFFNCVEDVSSEDMRKIWASVLAGEIKRPRSFSFRALETLKNISQEEAIVFNKVAACSVKIFDRLLLLRNFDILNEYNIRLDDLRLLDECGLLVFDTNWSIKITFDNDFVFDLTTDSLLIRLFNEPQKFGVFRINCMQFTVAGRELANALELVSNLECILKLIKTIEFDHSIYQLRAHPVLKDTSGKELVNMNIDLLRAD